MKKKTTQAIARGCFLFYKVKIVIYTVKKVIFVVTAIFTITLLYFVFYFHLFSLQVFFVLHLSIRNNSLSESIFDLFFLFLDSFLFLSFLFLSCFHVSLPSHSPRTWNGDTRRIWNHIHSVRGISSESVRRGQCDHTE